MFSPSIVGCHGAGVYTAMARKIDKDGNLIDPVNAPWKTGGAFTTPPGWWHSHVNETDEDAWVLPVQDAGLFTYQVHTFCLHTSHMFAAKCVLYSGEAAWLYVCQ
jgi:gentisate 1,2-dioxygenase